MSQCRVSAVQHMTTKLRTHDTYNSDSTKTDTDFLGR